MSLRSVSVIQPACMPALARVQVSRPSRPGQEKEPKPVLAEPPTVGIVSEVLDSGQVRTLIDLEEKIDAKCLAVRPGRDPSASAPLTGMMLP